MNSIVYLTHDLFQAAVEKVLRSDGDEVIAANFNLTIKGRDIHKLKPEKWLNDQVINFYMNLLIERGKRENFPSVYAFNTYFFKALLSKGYGHVRRWKLNNVSKLTD